METAAKRWIVHVWGKPFSQRGGHWGGTLTFPDIKWSTHAVIPSLARDMKGEPAGLLHRLILGGANLIRGPENHIGST